MLDRKRLLLSYSTLSHDTASQRSYRDALEACERAFAALRMTAPSIVILSAAKELRGQLVPRIGQTPPGPLPGHHLSSRIHSSSCPNIKSNSACPPADASGCANFWRTCSRRSRARTCVPPGTTPTGRASMTSYLGAAATASAVAVVVSAM